MGHVYLIGEKDRPNNYKIGSTRAKNIITRLNQLQTGNSSELYIKESYETEHPFKLEKMLHNHFKEKNLIGEWFELSESDIEAFKGVCEQKTKVIESLKDNPFFFKVKLVPFSEMKTADYTTDTGSRYSIEELQTQIEELTKEINKGISMKLEHKKNGEAI
jgi:hypothetical protein